MFVLLMKIMILISYKIIISAWQFISGKFNIGIQIKISVVILSDFQTNKIVL